MVLIAGDLNINISDIYSNASINLVSCLESAHFIPVITRPTRFPPVNSNVIPTTLDHIWINKLVACKSGIICMDMTDHAPNFIYFNLPCKSNNELTKIKIQFRPFSNESLNSLTDKLFDFDWNSLFSADIHENWSSFKDKLNYLYCQSFSIKTKFVSIKRLNKPWLSPYILRLVKQKSRYFKLYRMGIISKNVNNNFKNKINSIVASAKSNYYKSCFNDCKNDIKKCWNTINYLIQKKGSKQPITKLIFLNKIVTEATEISNVFNDYFVNVALELNEKLPASTESPTAYLDPPRLNTFSFRPVSPLECELIIKKLKLTKTDVNSLPVKLLIKLCSYVSRPLALLINSSFDTGIFPESLKIARITPIFKKGERHDPSNYRPVASLPILSKIIERCAVNQLISFCDLHSIFYKHQYGFQKGKSTSDALIELTENLYSNLNAKKTTLCILIDLQKAFDTVHHDTLLTKMDVLGVRGLSLDWFRNYLLNRKQYVSIGSAVSNVKTTVIGLPQGSIISPILFLLYINDIPKSSSMKTLLFADDSTFTISDKIPLSILNSLDDQLNRIKTWCISNKLTINAGKTELIKFSNSKNEMLNFEITFSGTRVNLVEDCKFLGVTLDSDLTFSKHIKSITAKLSRSCGVLYKLKNLLPQQARMNYYYGLMYPYLTYNIIVWGSTNPSHLNPLIILQKRIVRILAGSEYLAHSTPLFLKLSILKLLDLHKYFVCMYMFDERNREDFSINHNLNTRNRNNLQPKFHRLSKTQHALSYVGPKIWNDLPCNIKSVRSLPIFKRKLRNYLLSSYGEL